MLNLTQPQLLTSAELAMISGGEASVIVVILPEKTSNEIWTPGYPAKPPK
jgi:hypothetical protein